jgi:hypothetical protein
MTGLQLCVLDQPQLDQAGRLVWPTRLFKVWQIHAASRFAFLRPGLGPPKAVVRKAVGKVTEADFRAVFRRQPRP